jgi:subtilisin family serine protease
MQIPPLQPSASRTEGVDWNLLSIRAEESRQDFGARGEGIVVATIDTGVQYDHPALVAQYRGTQSDGTFDHNYTWVDLSKVCGNPFDIPYDNAEQHRDCSETTRDMRMI